MQGDDYILYCHPSRQKTPRSDRLREWYLSVLKVAKEQGMVTHLSNLFDTFFEGGRDHRDRASSTCLPYLDGAHPPGLSILALLTCWSMPYFIPSFRLPSQNQSTLHLLGQG